MFYLLMVILSATSVSAVGAAITVWETILPSGLAVSNATSIAAFTSETLPRILTHAPLFSRFRSTL